LAKPLKKSKKFVSLSSWLNLAEKTSSVKAKIIGGRTSSTSAGGSGVAQPPTCAMDLFDLGLPASDDKAAVLTLPRKRPQKSPVLKSVPRISEASITKDTFEQLLALHLFESYYIGHFLAFVTVKTVVASTIASQRILGAGVFVPMTR
jgi:hypothetical protein